MLSLPQLLAAFALRRTDGGVGVGDLRTSTAFLFGYGLESKKAFKVKLNSRKIESFTTCGSVVCLFII